MKSRFAILLALVVVFFSGATAGWAYGRREGMTRSQRPPPRPEDMQKRILEGLQRDLDLNPEQRAKIEPIVQETWSKVSEVQKNTGRQIREMFRMQHAQFKEFLTEAQWVKLQEVEARRWHRHGGTNSPASHSGGPPPMDAPGGPPPPTPSPHP